MADQAWKAFERDCAALFGGERHWANSGERLDFESSWAVGQCKLVQSLSLNALTKLAEEMAATEDIYKVGVVCTKVRRGKGKVSPMLVTMTGGQFSKLLYMLQYNLLTMQRGPQYQGTSAHREPV